jgi:hypothetical protein
MVQPSFTGSVNNAKQTAKHTAAVTKSGNHKVEGLFPVGFEKA